MIGLRELECSERIIAITSLIKESIDFWNDQDQDESISWLNLELDKLSDDIDACMLDADAIQVFGRHSWLCCTQSNCRTK